MEKAPRKGDVFSRILVRSDGWHAPSAHQFMVVTSVRKGIVHYRRCEHKRDAQRGLNYCEKYDDEAAGFAERIAVWGWKPDTLYPALPDPTPSTEETA